MLPKVQNVLEAEMGYAESSTNYVAMLPKVQNVLEAGGGYVINTNGLVAMLPKVQNVLEVDNDAIFSLLMNGRNAP